MVNTIALDCDGNNLLFAGCNFLGIKKLIDPNEDLERFECTRNDKSTTASAEWNPALAYKNQFAVTNNEHIMFASMDEGRLSTTSLKHHTRQVNHLNWHKTEPSQLASASNDCTALVWDTRDYRRPVIVFSCLAGVGKVRWNKLSSHLIATAHDNDLRIWDQRKGTAPIQYIAAHSNKIYSIDWSETHEYQLASSSHDCSVKLFDMTNPKRAESVMHTTGPVWRVSYTPWGEGLMTVVIPSPTEESTLQLWNISSHSGPVHSFVGPLDVIEEALWRNEGSDLQLLTWSRDQCLRAWRIEPFLQRLCGCTDNEARPIVESPPDCNDLNDTEVGTIAVSAKMSEELSPVLSVNSTLYETTEQPPESEILTLEEELAHLTSSKWTLPNVSCEKIEAEKRSCVVMVSLDHFHLSILISFPPSYPYNAAPSFQIDESCEIDSLLKAKLLKSLKHTAQLRVMKNRTCLESCLGQLVSCLEGHLAGEVTTSTSRVVLGSSPARIADPASVYSSFHDAYIPYPRSSGARFGSVGYLVCFGKGSRLVARQEQATPRSLSAATTHNYGSSYPRYNSSSSQDPNDSDFSFFLSERQRQIRGRGSRLSKLPRTVNVYDVSKLIFIHKSLAEKYIFDKHNISNSCVRNAAAAATIAGRSDLVQAWMLASLASAHVFQNGLSWQKHPFASSLMSQVIQHYAKISDVQTAAMLSCVYIEPDAEILATAPVFQGAERLLWKVTPRYHTIHATDSSLSDWVVPRMKYPRSNSWSQSLEEISTILEHREVVTMPRGKRSWLTNMREVLKVKYADVLYMWGMMERRTATMKQLADAPVPHSGLEFRVQCQHCNKPVVASASCTSCMRLALRCTICRILVRGASIICLSCGHGGHASHMCRWFMTEAACPTGCGCNCTFETRNAVH